MMVLAPRLLGLTVARGSVLLFQVQFLLASPVGEGAGQLLHLRVVGNLLTRRQTEAGVIALPLEGSVIVVLACVVYLPRRGRRRSGRILRIVKYRSADALRDHVLHYRLRHVVHRGVTLTAFASPHASLKCKNNGKYQIVRNRLLKKRKKYDFKESRRLGAINNEKKISSIISEQILVYCIHHLATSLRISTHAMQRIM